MKIRPLCKPLQEKAEKELNEIPSQIEKNLESLRNWLSKQPHLKYRDDDQLLVNFLRSSKYSLERTKEKLEAFYTFRGVYPDMAKNLDPLLPCFQQYFKLGITIPLAIPKDDPASARVFLIRYSPYDPDELTAMILIKGGFIINEVILNNEDNGIVSGLKIVWDLNGLQFKTASQVTPALLKKVEYYFEKALPARLKAIYFINVPKYLEPLVNLVKALASKKLSKRLHFYNSNNLEAIFSDIPKSIFPTEYGGDAGPHETLAAEFKKRVESYRETLVNEDNYYSEESKRLGKPIITAEDLFGMEGSFKKLELD